MYLGHYLQSKKAITFRSVETLQLMLYGSKSNNISLCKEEKKFNFNYNFVCWQEGDTVTVVVSHLTLEIDSKPVKNENVKQLYVEYRFLNYPPEELETPYPLPKPKNGLPVNYHFSKCKFSFSTFFFLSWP